MATRFRKSRKQRGSRFCGWGQIGQHRSSGSRGGVGQAGKHKHFYMRTNMEEPDHFGHEQTTSRNKDIVKKWINIKELDSLYFTNVHKSNSDTNLLDLTILGYDKLLGSGNLKTALTVKVNKISKKAIEKIQAAGGKVITNEHSTT